MFRRIITLLMLLTFSAIPVYAAYIGDLNINGYIDIDDAQEFLHRGDIAGAYSALQVLCGVSDPVETIQPTDTRTPVPAATASPLEAKTITCKSSDVINVRLLLIRNTAGAVSGQMKLQYDSHALELLSAEGQNGWVIRDNVLSKEAQMILQPTVVADLVFRVKESASPGQYIITVTDASFRAFSDPCTSPAFVSDAVEVEIGSTPTPAAVVTPTPAPSEGQVAPIGPNITLVLNTNSKKIHKPACKYVNRISAKNFWAVEFSLEECLNMEGYTLCGHCFN